MSFIQPTYKERFEPELTALLNLVLFKLSVYDSGASYGSQLQNLKFRNEWMHKGSRKMTIQKRKGTRLYAHSLLPSGIDCSRCSVNTNTKDSLWHIYGWWTVCLV